MSLPIIAICVPTFQRPQGLELLCQSLANLNIAGFQPHLIIVDNDSEGTGRSTADAFKQSAPFPVTYVIEPARGLSTVRNRLVAEANAIGAEYLAFADDDQTVDSNWLSSALDLLMNAQADIVVCNVKHVFPDGTPRHVRACFKEWDYETGTRIYRANTGGTVYRLSKLGEIPGPFDTRMNFTGGEDSILGRMLVQIDARILFSADAIVNEHVPASRCTPDWIIKRAYRVGTTRSKIAKWVSPSPVRLIKTAVISGGLIVVSFAQLLYYLVVDRSQWLNRVRKIANGFGGLAALVSTNASPAEYKNTHGE